MAATDSRGVVSSVGTLSKAIAPGLRMVFVGAPKQLLEDAARCEAAWRVKVTTKSIRLAKFGPGAGLRV